MPKRVLTGTVVSDKGDKTVVVSVERRVKHPLYGKIIKRSKKYHAHDEANAIRVGEVVRIEECAPVSKTKSWKILDRVGTAKLAEVELEDVETVQPAAEAVEKTAPKASKKKSAKAEDVAEADA